MSKLFDRTMPKFLLVGIVNTLIGCGAMFLLYNLLGCSYWISSAANYVLGGVVSFFLNKFFTFQNKAKSWRQVLRFILTVSVCYLFSYGIAKPLVMHILKNSSVAIQENIAMLTGMCFYTVLNYLGQRFYAFKSEN